jgi:hypothetical protein
MANLFFPQLSSGALAQYPIRKTQVARSVKNILPDGRMILLPDPGAARLLWELSYSDLAPADIAALQFLYSSCSGPLRAFTFIDPTGNMLAWSSDLTQQTWQISSQIKVSGGAQDPEGGSAAFTLANLGQAPQQISQTLAVPANYQYCFSVYASSSRASNITLAFAGSSAQETKAFGLGRDWARLSFAGKLADPGFTLTVSISLEPGQQVQLYGIQLQPQLAPSRYRPTAQRGGVYPNAHWATEELVIAAQAPNLFSTAFSIETAI